LTAFYYLEKQHHGQFIGSVDLDQET
jgi:hypothetical protein